MLALEAAIASSLALRAVAKSVGSPAAAAAACAAYLDPDKDSASELPAAIPALRDSWAAELVKAIEAATAAEIFSMTVRLPSWIPAKAVWIKVGHSANGSEAFGSAAILVANSAFFSLAAVSCSVSLVAWSAFSLRIAN